MYYHNVLNTNQFVSERDESSDEENRDSHLAALKNALQLDTAKVPIDEVTELLHFLYLGNAYNARDMNFIKSKPITHVINCASSGCNTGPQSYREPIKYLEFDARDECHYDMMQHYDEAYEFIEDARKSNGCVLIHCFAGINRSALLAAAYMMVHTQSDPIKVATNMRERRGLVLQNGHFQEQLINFAMERNLLPKKKCNIQ